MMHFSDMEALGISVAAISDRSDGNCSGHAPCMEDRIRFVEKCGATWLDLVCPKQVHGTTLVSVSDTDRGKGAAGHATAIAEADGLYTNLRGIPLGVTVADCAPVFLVAKGGAAGALVHAGRAGTLQGISAAAVKELCCNYQIHPEQMYALIGPSAGPCCYEVSPEMAHAFLQAGLPVRERYLDLWEANRLQLNTAGIPSSQIVITGRCTICDGAFHSYRATATDHRNLALLAL
ncbi:MAG TPA: polyphenol oxidase family protein [Candidatus Hydrogenedentes bacterium]|nr:polyphenol oxidase family protein [Candidatus Hydrogenedentota bacterium]